MLINNLNNWFNNNPSSHYASQPNFNLSDYQQIEQTSEKSSTNGNHHNQRVYSANTSAAKDSFNRIRKGSNQLVHQKQISPNQQSTPSHIKYQKQPHPVKKQIKSAFSPQIKSRSTLNLSNTNSSSANNINSPADHNVVNTAICELTSKTCTNFSQPTNQANSFDVESSTVNTSEQNRRLNDPRAKFASNLDLRNHLLMNPNSSSNPFNSNYEYACKNTSSYIDWNSRFKSRLNPSLCILDYKLQSGNQGKEPTDSSKPNPIRPNAKNNSYDTEYRNYLKKIFELFHMNGMTDNFENIDKKLDKSTFSLYVLNPTDDQKLESNKSKNSAANLQKVETSNSRAEINNYFLNYRQVTKKEGHAKPPKSADPSSNKRHQQQQNQEKVAKADLYQELTTTKSTFAERVRSKTAAPSGTTPAHRNLTLQLEEHRKRNGPEKYLEPLKIIDIKKWIEQVETVQSVEGKCLETISKCRLYTD